MNRILFVRNLPFKITAEEVCFHLEQRDEYSIFLTKMCLFMGERLQLGVHVCACVPVRLRAGVPLSVRLCVCVSLCLYFSVSLSLCVRLRDYDRVQLGDTQARMLTYADKQTAVRFVWEIRGHPSDSQRKHQRNTWHRCAQ